MTRTALALTLQPMRFEAGIALLLVAPGCAPRAGALPADDESWFQRAPSRPSETRQAAPAGTGAEPSSWTTLEAIAGRSASTLTIEPGESGPGLRGTIVQASSRAAVTCYRGEDLALVRCILWVVPGTVPDDRSLFGLRGFDMSGTRLEEVEVTGFRAPEGVRDAGHGVYLNVVGAATLLECDIHHNGGEGLRLVNRPDESSSDAAPGAGAIAIGRTSFRDNGYDLDDRGAQLSILGTGQEVRIADVEIRWSFDPALGPACLVIEPEAPDQGRGGGNVWWRPAGADASFEAPFTQERTGLERVRIVHEGEGRTLVRIKGCRELHVRDSDFPVGRIELDDPDRPGRPCGRIVWEGNTGDATVVHQGVELGPASRDFTID